MTQKARSLPKVPTKNHQPTIEKANQHIPQASSYMVA